MTRQELRDKMLQSGEINRPDKANQHWLLAFDLYKAETKDFQISIQCGSCFKKVAQWLRK